MSENSTTRRAEEIRETTGCTWEYACLQAERERDRDAAAFGPEIPGLRGSTSTVTARASKP